ncbi:hypothetical protein FE257_007471 [Aspergillus nanangensis]|uniref:Uncharacterized protein n=1 Tax=Aspergillus nanangensis TaxID=2582783 RepID=A0AAD4GU64_ASPNN|nr:hypothetical protein FE257_007471 [Aspergillus nanangensis]
MQLSLLFTAAVAVFSSAAIAIPQEVEPPADICLMICSFDKMNCTTPSYPKKTGEVSVAIVRTVYDR